MAIPGANTGAAVRFPLPPVLFAVPLALALAADRWVLRLPPPGAGHRGTRATGAAIAVAGARFGLSGVLSVLRHGTTVVPHHAVTRLVTAGPFRVTRNPMYTGHLIVLLGAALRTGRGGRCSSPRCACGPRHGWSTSPRRSTSPADSARTTTATGHGCGAGSDVHIPPGRTGIPTCGAPGFVRPGAALVDRDRQQSVARTRRSGQLSPPGRHRHPFPVDPRRAARRSFMMRRLPGIATSNTPAIAANNNATPTGSTPSRAKKKSAPDSRSAG